MSKAQRRLPFHKTNSPILIEFAKKLNVSLDTNQNLTTLRTQSTIPFWVKESASNWHYGTINNTGFSKVIQYMISGDLIGISSQEVPTGAFEHIPLWVGNVVGWWTQGLISKNEFVNSIQFLLTFGIIEP